jgi:hypothetical protein
MSTESPQDRTRRLARERKQKQRKRDTALDMQQWKGKFSSGERAAIAEGAGARGFEDETEYLFDLVRRDLSRL